MTIMVRLKFIGLFTLFHGDNWNQQGGRVLLCGLQPFVLVWQHFRVAGRNFEEILQHKTIKRFCCSLNVMIGYLQARRQGGFEGVRANPPFDVQKILYTPLNCTFKYPTV